MPTGKRLLTNSRIDSPDSPVWQCTW